MPFTGQEAGKVSSPLRIFSTTIHAAGAPGAQALEITGRVAQAVGVIDAQAVDLARLDPAQHERVRVAEHLGALGAQAASVLTSKKRR